MTDAKPTAAQILAMTAQRKRRRLLQRLLVALALGGALLAFFWQRSQESRAAGPSFVTAEAKLGRLRETVTATGKFKGLDAVDVGAQISGRVARVLVDFNDRVTTGQTLAEIDPAQQLSRVEQSRAQVLAMDASVRLAQATLVQAKAALARSQDMVKTGLISSKELEAAAADAERAEAGVASAQAQARLARASLKDAETSLSFTTIKSPIDGIVLARLVEPGQTVAASLQSPVLFTLARDLTKLLLYVDVDEADIGKLREGQDATFSVGAWPKRKFSSKVVSVHNLPTAGQTVVTYQAVLSVDNSDLSLRPGMTATATIVTSDREGVLIVPDAALRFTPPKPDKPRSGPLPFMPVAASPRGARRVFDKPDATLSAAQGILWLLENGAPQRAVVELGASDGQFTEVSGGGIEPGAVVILDQEQPAPR